MNHDQLLRLIRDKVSHPATPRELEQRLDIPEEDRATFKRLLADLVARGALLETRGNRFGLADMMDLIVGRSSPIRADSASSPRTGRSRTSTATFTSRAAI